VPHVLDPAEQSARNGRNKPEETPMTIEHIDSGDYLSKAVTHNGIAYIAGMTATDRSKDIAGQTAEVLEKIDTYLARCGTDKSKILFATIYLTDMSDKDAMNAVWIPWLGDLQRPARACVGASLASPDILLEIVVTAAI
jgi:enamine deaminase RidA (YjgF/YER057c/UK114 family)